MNFLNLNRGIIHMKFITFVFLTIVFFISGCDTKTNKSEIAMQEKINKMEERISDLESDKFWADIGKVAYLTPASSGYSTINFDLGTLTVKMKDVQPFANAARVTLEFGNTLGSTIMGLKAKVEWGTVDAKGLPDKELGSKEITMDKDIQSASWNKIIVTLENTDPKNLGYIRVKNVTHTGIKLRN